MTFWISAYLTKCVESTPPVRTKRTPGTLKIQERCQGTFGAVVTATIGHIPSVCVFCQNTLRVHFTNIVRRTGHILPDKDKVSFWTYGVQHTGRDKFWCRKRYLRPRTHCKHFFQRFVACKQLSTEVGATPYNSDYSKRVNDSQLFEYGWMW